VHEDDARLRFWIDEAKDLAKRCGYPTVGYFLDLAAADIEKTQPAPKPDPKIQSQFAFERHWSWSWRGWGARERDSFGSLKATPTLLVRLS
jgi:hypothetical protein